ncbi:hypothetical protein AB2P54_19685, partial [Acinetobacter baumannii]
LNLIKVWLFQVKLKPLYKQSLLEALNINESDLVKPTGMVSPACTLLVKNNDGIPRLSVDINFFIRCYKIVKYIKLLLT